MSTGHQQTDAPGAPVAKLPPSLEPLAQQLTALSDAERRQVVASAERIASNDAKPDTMERRKARWAKLRALAGVVNLGGDAVEDCERLYDG